MKSSMFSWEATLGIVGSAFIGASTLGSIAALALPQEQIVQKLGPVPVFTITDQTGAPLVASSRDAQNKQESVAGVFINQKDAQAFIEQLKTKNPDLAKTVRVVPVSLGEIYKLDRENESKPNALNIAYVPSQQQVNAAVTLLQQSDQKVEKFNGTPLFVARAGKEKGYLTVKSADQQVIPFFFNKEELQNMLEKFKQQQPDLAASVDIQVVNLEGMIQTLQTRNEKELNQIMLVPPRESIEFVRSLKPTSAPNQTQPAPNPATKPPTTAPSPQR